MGGGQISDHNSDSKQTFMLGRNDEAIDDGDVDDGGIGLRGKLEATSFDRL